MRNALAKLLTTKAENIHNAPKVVFSALPEYNRYPLVATPTYAGVILPEWIKENKDLFEQKLHAYGAILFRGFGINTVEGFQHFLTAFDASPLAYRHRSSPRFEVAKNIYHSTTYPEDESINMHSENSYALHWAMNIVFCCVQPAIRQGETPIADNRLVLNNLSQKTRSKFLDKGVKYVRNMSAGLGLPWEEVFQTTRREDVEQECKSGGMEFRWEEDNRLVLSWHNKAIHTHPATREPVWFNHAFFFNKFALGKEVLASFQSDDELPFNTYFGDGSEITKEEVEEMRSAYQQAMVTFPWEKGDVLFLDNMLMSHGRSPYAGPRKVIVSMI